ARRTRGGPDGRAARSSSLGSEKGKDGPSASAVESWVVGKGWRNAGVTEGASTATAARDPKAATRPPFSSSRVIIDFRLAKLGAFPATAPNLTAAGLGFFQPVRLFLKSWRSPKDARRPANVRVRRPAAWKGVQRRSPTAIHHLLRPSRLGG